MLAFWVMLFHLLPIPVIGGYAVFAFFILSGFLMTTIMHESYGFTTVGVKKYAINRFLRLYPMYWAACATSIIAIIAIGAEYSGLYHAALFIPSDITAVLSNFTMIFPAFMPNEITPRLSPATWALTVEICFYILIALGISKTFKRTLIWLGCGISYYAISYILGLGNEYRYSAIIAASLPFSLGAFLYFKKEEIFNLLKFLKVSHPVTIMLLYVGNAMVFTFIAHYGLVGSKSIITEIGKYLNILFSVLVVASLFYRGHEICNKKLDKSIGDYSYPLYLLHWQCGLFASYLLYQSPSRDFTQEGIISFILASVFVIALSYILIILIDDSISKMRNRIRENKLGQVAETG